MEGCFRGFLYTCLWMVLFWVYNGVLLGLFVWFPARFALCLRTKILEWFWLIIFVCPPSCFARLVLVLFCCALYGVLCMCCVCFVCSLSRTWLAPVQRCMYDTCYMGVLSHKTMQKCEKLHNKTLQTTTSVHVN